MCLIENKRIQHGEGKEEVGCVWGGGQEGGGEKEKGTENERYGEPSPKEDRIFQIIYGGHKLLSLETPESCSGTT